MKIEVLGTGMVGRALAGKLAEVGPDVMVGTRDVDRLRAAGPGERGEEPFSDWHAKHSQFPETRVVKALNTVTASVMVDPDPWAAAITPRSWRGTTTRRRPG